MPRPCNWTPSSGYVEGLHGEYVITRVTLQELVRHQRAFAQRMGLKPGQSVVKAILETLHNTSINPADSSKPLPEDADAQVERTTPTELSRRVAEVNRYYHALLGLDGVPYAARLGKLTALKTVGGEDVLSHVVQAIQPTATSMVAYSRGISRATATLRAMECLVALRRWQLSHCGGGSLRDLASVVRSAGLKAVPTDPYDGKPMRLAIVDGQPIIYSVGRDGKDDGGRTDSKLDMNPGDLIYRLPPAEARR
jgi:hypothetical protein